jgi:hypothetical protein
MDEGTWESHRSSSLESVDEREEYHDPAWLATLVVILKLVRMGSCMRRRRM